MILFLLTVVDSFDFQPSKFTQTQKKIGLWRFSLARYWSHCFTFWFENSLLLSGIEPWPPVSNTGTLATMPQPPEMNLKIQVWIQIAMEYVVF